MKPAGWFNRLKGQFSEARIGVLALPPQGRTLVYIGGATFALLTFLALANVVGWWISAASDVATAKPRISRLLGYIEAGRSSGAKLVAGGGVPKDQPRGWFVAPTVFADVDNSDRIAQEEIFGPVLAVIPYDGDAEAVALANDSEFGLAGTVWSADEDRATEVAREISTGTVGINDYQLDMNAPFGGVKASGIGRELGPEGLDEFFALKSIYRTGPPAG